MKRFEGWRKQAERAAIFLCCALFAAMLSAPLCGGGEELLGEMTFSPAEPTTNDTLTIMITAEIGYVYVDLVGMGPEGPVDPEWIGVTGDGPYTWSYRLRNLVEGTYTFTFTADNGETLVARGSVFVRKGSGTGQPAASPFIYGIHSWSPGAATLLEGKKGWTTETILATDPIDVARYDQMIAEGYSIILRINNGYNNAGTIPLDPADYPAFASRCGSIAATLGDRVRVYVIGNEMNAPYEGDGTNGIPADDYVLCFRMTRNAIKAAAPGAIVLPGAVANWNPQPILGCSGPYEYPWDNYLHCLVTELGNDTDGYTVHTYGGRGGDPDPRDDGYWGFGNYKDQIRIIDAAGGADRPIYITEFNHAANGWHTSNGQNYPNDPYPDGWIEKAFQDIDAYNAQNRCRIKALCWFTYDLDGWQGFNLTYLSA
ncbi:MAG: hypothetical protein D6812_07815, partial [Deltaproteobacteria bacterium]